MVWVVNDSSAPRQQRDAAATQQKILDSAETEFSRHGLKGARVGAIAKGAGVTTAMIHYYFGNKEGLYRAVLQRPVEQVQDLIDDFDLTQYDSVEAAMTRLIELMVTYESAHPQRQMLWFQEANQNGGEYFKEGNWPGIYKQMLVVLDRGIREGVFRPIEDRLLTLLHIIGLVIFYFTVHENWKHVTPDVDRFSAEEIQKHTDAATTFVLQGLKQF